MSNPVPDSSPAPQRLHLAFLDCLRGLAILMVLVVHAAEAAHVPDSGALWKLALMGQRGVELFYMVSAFTLFLSLDRARPEPHPRLAFFVRRFFRIAPAFYAVLVAELVLFHFHPGGAYRYGLAFLFLNGWSPAAINLGIVGCWSVAVEATFYLFVPWLHGRIRTLHAALLWFGVAALVFTPASFLLAWVMPHSITEYFELLWFPVQIPVFLLGIVTYMAWKELQATGSFALSHRRTWAYALLTVAFVLFAGNVEWRERHVFYNLRLLPCALSLLFLILAGSLWEWPVLFNRFTGFIGKISYSMYLAHFFLLWEYARLYPSPPAFWLSGSLGTVTIFCVLLAAMIPVSWLMWRLIEQPGIQLGRQVIERLEHSAAPPSPTIADHAAI